MKAEARASSPQGHLPSPGGTWQEDWENLEAESDVRGPQNTPGRQAGSLAKGLEDLTLASLKTKPAAPAFTHLFQIPVCHLLHPSNHP